LKSGVAIQDSHQGLGYFEASGRLFYWIPQRRSAAFPIRNTDHLLQKAEYDFLAKQFMFQHPHFSNPQVYLRKLNDRVRTLRQERVAFSGNRRVNSNFWI
jgi:hypothetical protein